MKLIVNVDLNGVTLPFEVDTGSPVNLTSEPVYKQYFDNVALKQCRQLVGVSGEAVRTHGSFNAKIQRTNRRFSGRTTIVVQAADRDVGLLGIPGLDVLFPGWRQTFADLGGKIANLDNIEDYIKRTYPGLVNEDFTLPVTGVVVALHLVEGPDQFFRGHVRYRITNVMR